MMFSTVTANQELPRKKVHPAVKVMLKLVFSLACLWYINTKIDLGHSLATIKQLNVWYLVAAVALFLLSKVLSSIRLNFYFRNIGINISESTNLRLYLLGMFMNLFLPGSIGGDAYKVYRLHTTFHIGYKPTIAAVLFDRFSGLLALFIFMIILLVVAMQGQSYSFLLIGSIPLSIGCLYLITKKFFPILLSSFWTTFFYGLLVQLLQMACMMAILLALGVRGNFAGYQSTFLLSSAVAVLPFTIGGLGARELVFMYGADFLHLNHELAVSASFAFYLTNVLACLTGLPFLFYDPLTKLSSRHAPEIDSNIA